MKNGYDFGGRFAQTYTNQCECGEEVEVSTQEDNNPEYLTTVFVRCKCGKSVKFNLPVN